MPVELEVVKQIVRPGFKIQPGSRLLFAREGTAAGFIRSGECKRVSSAKPKAKPVDTAADSGTGTKAGYTRRSKADPAAVTE